MKPSDALPDLPSRGDGEGDGDDVDADDAGEAAAQATEDHGAAEGVDASESSGMGSSSSLREMLLSTGPERDLSNVESPWDPENGGETRFYRGVQKALDFDGMPAVVDMVIGVFEFLHEFEPAGGDEQEDAGDGGGEGGPAPGGAAGV